MKTFLVAAVGLLHCLACNDASSRASSPSVPTSNAQTPTVSTLGTQEKISKAASTTPIEEERARERLAIVPSPAPATSWRSPAVACDLLKDNGLTAEHQVGTGLLWFDVGTEDGSHACVSKSKILSDEDYLRNSIALQVSGTREVAKIFNLSMSLFDKAKSRGAHAEMLRLSALLLERIDGSRLPAEAASALTKAKAGIFKAGSWRLDVRRADYVNAPRGGYELRLLLYEASTPKPPEGF